MTVPSCRLVRGKAGKNGTANGHGWTEDLALRAPPSFAPRHGHLHT